MVHELCPIKKKKNMDVCESAGFFYRILRFIITSRHSKLKTDLQKLMFFKHILIISLVCFFFVLNDIILP